MHISQYIGLDFEFRRVVLGLRIPDRRAAVLRVPDFIRLAGVRTLDIRALGFEALLVPYVRLLDIELFLEALLLFLVPVDRLFDWRVVTVLRAAFRIFELRVVFRAPMLRVVRGFRALVDFRTIVLRTLIAFFLTEISIGEADLFSSESPCLLLFSSFECSDFEFSIVLFVSFSILPSIFFLLIFWARFFNLTLIVFVLFELLEPFGLKSIMIQML